MLRLDTAQREPVAPSEDAVALLKKRYRWAAPLGRRLLGRWVRGVELTGLEHLQGEPVLVLMNHGCPIDPMIFGCYAGIPVQWLVTAPAMQQRYWRSRPLAAFGQIPKRKLEPETRAMRTMKAWAAAGASVGVFPEGIFSWDGAPQPLQPGLNQLVHYLGLPVVTVRVENGDRFWPAWSKRPRSTTLGFTLDPPRRFGPREDVAAAVAEAIHVDPLTSRRWPVTGTGMASGLARLLGWCPECGAPGTLSEAGNALTCGACDSHWEVGPDTGLRGTVELSIRAALDRVQQHVEGSWDGAPRLQSLGEVEVRDLTGELEQTLVSGSLTLEQGSLRNGAWSLPLADVLGVTRDWPDRIVLRTRRTRVGLDLESDSRALWMYAIRRGIECVSAD